MFGHSPLMANSLPPLTTQLSATSRYASSTAITINTASVTCTVAGGLEPYSYQWTLVSGTAEISAMDPNSATTAFTSTLTAGETDQATFVCVVTDATGAEVVSGNVSVTITRQDSVTTYLSTYDLLVETQLSSATSGSVTATAYGGADPYNFSWAKTTGDSISINSPNSASTSFSASGLTVGVDRVAYFRARAFDSNGLADNSTSLKVTFRRASSSLATPILSPNVIYSYISSSSGFSDTSCTCSASGGVPPYSYSWYKKSGGNIGIQSPSSATTRFIAVGMTSREKRTAEFRCKVTDAAGNERDSSFNNAVVVAFERTT